METVGKSLLEWGVAALAMPGQEESGDRYLVKEFRQGGLLAVVDGLGHGAEAARAAMSAIRTLDNNAHESVISLVRRCHESLRGTRGAVMSIASFNKLDETVTFLGVGNVESMLLRADVNARPGYESPILRGGVVGGQLPPLRASVIPISRGDTMILVSDGIESGFAHQLPLSSPPQQIADHILKQHNKGTDDALALVARYVGARP